MANTLKNTSALAGISATNIYTCPASGVAATVVPSIVLANIDGVNQVTVTLQLYIATLATTVQLLYLAPIPPGASIIFDKPVFMVANDVLKVLANATNSVQATIGFVETS